MGLGVGVNDQVCPFQLSAKLIVWNPDVSGTDKLPTAWQDEVEAQETEFKVASSPGAFEGVGRTVQVAPFHSSARNPKEGEGVEPTAMQKLVLKQETPESESSPFGLGLNTQVAPFQYSTSVPESPFPTAMQKLVLVQETPERKSLVSVGGFGLGTTDQFEPFHNWTKVLSPPPRSSFPTAIQNPVPTHDIPVMLLKLLDTFGLGETDPLA